MREGYFRKGRENQQETFSFYDAETNRVASFRKGNGKFSSFWKMEKHGQIDEFLNNNNNNNVIELNMEVKYFKLLK